MTFEWWRRRKKEEELRNFQKITWWMPEHVKENLRRDMRRLGYKPHIYKSQIEGSKLYECSSQGGKKWGAGPTPKEAYESWL